VGYRRKMDLESALRRAFVKRAMDAANAYDPRLEMEPSDDPVDDEWRLAGLLTDLSHDPVALHALLDPEPDGADVAERVLQLRRQVGTGIDAARGTHDFFMVMRDPVALDRATVEATVRRHYASMAQLVAELGAAALAQDLAAPVPIQHSHPPDVPFEGTCEHSMLEVCGDGLFAAGGGHPLLALHEAAYTIACSYPLAYWVLWPAYRHTVRTPDPFATAMELWGAGVRTSHRGAVIFVVDA
jgi:hypothetical protein